MLSDTSTPIKSRHVSGFYCVLVARGVLLCFNVPGAKLSHWGLMSKAAFPQHCYAILCDTRKYVTLPSTQEIPYRCTGVAEEGVFNVGGCLKRRVAILPGRCRGTQRKCCS